MTAEEAIKILEESPYKDSGKPSRCNQALTCKQFWGIVRDYVAGLPPQKVLEHLFEKRVYQASKNQRAPRF
jgi:hypothetical protein